MSFVYGHPEKRFSRVAKSHKATNRVARLVACRDAHWWFRHVSALCGSFIQYYLPRPFIQAEHDILRIMKQGSRVLSRKFADKVARVSGG